MTRQGRVAHGPGDCDRRLAVVEQVEQEDGLFDGVGSLRHHGARSAGAGRLADQPGDIGDLQRRTGNLAHLMDLDAGSGRGQAGHRCQELLAAQRGDRPGTTTSAAVTTRPPASATSSPSP